MTGNSQEITHTRSDREGQEWDDRALLVMALGQTVPDHSSKGVEMLSWSWEFVPAEKWCSLALNQSTCRNNVETGLYVPLEFLDTCFESL